MTSLDELRAALRELRSGELAIAPEELDSVAGELASAQAAILLRAVRASTPAAITPPRTEQTEKPTLLTAKAAASLIGRSRWWLWAHREQIPHVVLPACRPGGKDRVAFTEARLRRWLRERGQ